MVVMRTLDGRVILVGLSGVHDLLPELLKVVLMVSILLLGPQEFIPLLYQIRRYYVGRALRSDGAVDVPFHLGVLQLNRIEYEQDTYDTTDIQVDSLLPVLRNGQCQRLVDVVDGHDSAEDVLQETVRPVEQATREERHTSSCVHMRVLQHVVADVEVATQLTHGLRDQLVLEPARWIVGEKEANGRWKSDPREVAEGKHAVRRVLP